MPIVNTLQEFQPSCNLPVTSEHTLDTCATSRALPPETHTFAVLTPASTSSPFASFTPFGCTLPTTLDYSFLLLCLPRSAQRLLFLDIVWLFHNHLFVVVCATPSSSRCSFSSVTTLERRKILPRVVAHDCKQRPSDTTSRASHFVNTTASTAFLGFRTWPRAFN